MFIKNCNLSEIHVLPYHNYGMPKYEQLNRKYELEDVEIPKKEKMEEIKRYIEDRGFKVLIGG